jgi:flagellar FliL protein
MSAVIADPVAGAAPLGRGKKKLLVIGAAVLAVLLLLTAGGLFLLKQRAARAAADAGEEDAAAEMRTAKVDLKYAPTYLPLDPFVVNLADRDVDRYAQIGITLELENGASGDRLKAYMPAVRNAILLVLANKTSRDLLDRAGKELLAQEIMREAVRPMGIEVALPEPVTGLPTSKAASAAAAGASAVAAAGSASATTAAAASASGTSPSASSAASGVPALAVAGVDDAAPPKAKPRPRRDARNPIQHVHFSSFIIQ